MNTIEINRYENSWQGLLSLNGTFEEWAKKPDEEIWEIRALLENDGGL